MKKILLGDPEVNRQVAEIIGMKYHERDFYFEHNGRKYAHFTGGVAWPGFQIDGYAVIVGVESSEPHLIQCLWEMESDDAGELFRGCLKAQKKLGKGKYPEICGEWWGNPERMMSLISEKNLQGRGDMMIAHPPDYDEKDAFQIYLAQLKTNIMQTNKVLKLNDSTILRNSLSSFISGEKVTEETHPPIAVAGWLVHTLLAYRPWEQAVVREELIPTDQQEYGQYEHQKAVEEIMGGAWD